MGGVAGRNSVTQERIRASQSAGLPRTASWAGSGADRLLHG